MGREERPVDDVRDAVQPEHQRQPPDRAAPVDGLLQRFRGRARLTPVSACLDAAGGSRRKSAATAAAASTPAASPHQARRQAEASPGASSIGTSRPASSSPTPPPATTSPVARPRNDGADPAPADRQDRHDRERRRRPDQRPGRTPRPGSRSRARRGQPDRRPEQAAHHHPARPKACRERPCRHRGEQVRGQPDAGQQAHLARREAERIPHRRQHQPEAEAAKPLRRQERDGSGGQGRDGVAGRSPGRRAQAAGREVTGRADPVYHPLPAAHSAHFAIDPSRKSVPPRGCRVVFTIDGQAQRRNAGTRPGQHERGEVQWPTQSMCRPTSCRRSGIGSHHSLDGRSRGSAPNSTSVACWAAAPSDGTSPPWPGRSTVRRRGRWAGC